MRDRNLELLEKVLSDNSIELANIDKDEVKEEIVEQADLFLEDNEELTKLIEGSMRESLRRTIQESDVSDSVKVNQLVAIEDVNFTDEQKEQYIYDSINPIVTTSGILEFEGEEPVFVPTVVFETAMALELAKNGEFETISELAQIKESIIEEAKKKEKKEEDEDEEDESEDEEDESEDEEDEDEDEDEEEECQEKPKGNKKKGMKESEDPDNKNILESYLKQIFEDWDINTDRQARLVIENAENSLKLYGAGNLLPDTIELCEIGLIPFDEGWGSTLVKATKAGIKGAKDEWKWNKAGRQIAKLTGKTKAVDNVAKYGKVAAGTAAGSVVAAKSLVNSSSQPVNPGLIARVRSAVSSAFNTLGDAGKKVASRISNMSTAGKFALGAATLGLLGTLAYRKFVGSGADKATAAKKAAVMIKSQARNCAGSSNPEKCRQAVKAQSSKWENRS